MNADAWAYQYTALLQYGIPQLWRAKFLSTDTVRRCSAMFMFHPTDSIEELSRFLIESIPDEPATLAIKEGFTLALSALREVAPPERGRVCRNIGDQLHELIKAEQQVEHLKDAAHARTAVAWPSELMAHEADYVALRESLSRARSRDPLFDLELRIARFPEPRGDLIDCYLVPSSTFGSFVHRALVAKYKKRYLKLRLTLAYPCTRLARSTECLERIRFGKDGQLLAVTKHDAFNGSANIL